MGAVVPGPGKNKDTEVDTTVFAKTDIATDGLGKTTGNGKNTVDMMTMAMAQSGATLPQVSADGTGTISGTYHIVTTDGAGPIAAMLDTTGTGTFSSGVPLKVVTQVPGTGGNIKPSAKRSLWVRAMDTIMKRAANVNEDYVSLPPPSHNDNLLSLSFSPSVTKLTHHNSPCPSPSPPEPPAPELPVARATSAWSRLPTPTRPAPSVVSSPSKWPPPPVPPAPPRLPAVPPRLKFSRL
jgi:hypothetical protein